MSKYSDIMAESAYALCSHGLALDEWGHVEESIGWNALVEVSEHILSKVGEAELAERYEEEHVTSEFLVWVQECSQGFVRVVEFGSDEGFRSGTDMVNEAWNRFIAGQEQ